MYFLNGVIATKDQCLNSQLLTGKAIQRPLTLLNDTQRRIGLPSQFPVLLSVCKCQKDKAGHHVPASDVKICQIFTACLKTALNGHWLTNVREDMDLPLFPSPCLVYTMFAQTLWFTVKQQEGDRNSHYREMCSNTYMTQQQQIGNHLWIRTTSLKQRVTQ